MAQSGSNIPCPCGSGKPIKDCCFAVQISTLKDDILSRVANQEEPLTPDTISQIAREIAHKHQSYNTSPIDDFKGLTPNDMNRILYHPFDSESTVRINLNPKGFAKSPIYRLFTLFVKELEGNGIKATAKGNLGRNACRHIAEQYFTKEEYEEFTELRAIHTEEDFREIVVLRHVCALAGFIRKYKGKFILAKKCQKLLSEHKEAEIYHELFRTYCTKFNWAYGDRCYDHPFFQYSFMFTLYLLQKLGEDEIETDFYGEAFITTFPHLKKELMEIATPYEQGKEDYYINLCLHIRVIDRFAQFFGFVEIKEVGEDYFNKKHMVKKTPLLDEMFTFRKLL